MAKGSPKPQKSWRKVTALEAYLDDMSQNQRDFVNKLRKYGNPFDLDDELTEKKKKWLDWLFDYYVNGEKNARYSKKKVD